MLIIAQFEITNPWQFNVMVARSIARGPAVYGTDYTTMRGTFVAPELTSNVTPAEHHLRDQVLAIDQGRSGSVEYHLTLSAAADAKTETQDHLIFEPHLGGIWVLAFKGSC